LASRLYRAARIDMARMTEAEQPSLDDLSRHLQLSQLIADRVRCAVLLQLQVHSRISGNSHADAEAVAAAKTALATAKQTREAECDKRGSNCRQREMDEQTAATALREATANKAATDAAKRYEAQIGAVKAKLAGPEGAAIAHANPLGHALALIIGSAADVLTARMQAIIALVFDLCLVGLMIGVEALGHVRASPARSEETTRNSNDTSPSARPTITVDPEPVPTRWRPVSRPKLVAASAEPLAGSIPKIMTEALEPATGKRVELEEAFGAYTGACEAEGKRAVPPGLFVDPLRNFCEAAGIRIKDEGGHMYLMNVRLAANPSRVQQEAVAR
jgi:hypothetical protein